jgi:hypothetical protein
MKRYLTLFGAFCLMIAGVVPAIIVNAVTPAGATGPGTTVTVTQASPGWGFIDDNAQGGSGMFVTGPGTPVAGTGSVRLRVTNTSQGYAFGSAKYGGVAFSQLTNLGYSTYRTSPSAPNDAISLQLSVDYDLTDAATTWQGRAVWLPDAGTVNSGVWQTWSPLTQGKWYGSNNSPKVANVVVPQLCSLSGSGCTWAQFTADYPQAGVNALDPQYLFKIGSGNSGFDGNVDNATVGVAGNDTTYNFELGGAQVDHKVVGPSTPGWGFVDDNSNGGTGVLVNGPATPPSGTGSAQISLSASNQGYLFGTAEFDAHGGTNLSDITSLGYSTYQPVTNTGSNALSLQFPVDYDTTDSTTSYQGRVTFEPSSTGAVTNGVWQTWNPLTQGTWWQTGTPKIAKVTGAIFCTQAIPCSWSALVAHYPRAAINPTDGFPAIVFKAGSGWAVPFTGAVDNFAFGVSGNTTVYDFESGTQCTTVCYVNGTTGDDSYGGSTPGTAKKTIQAALDVVASGGTVNVAAGTYVQNLSVTTPVVLNGAGQASTIVEPALSAPNPLGCGSSLCAGASNVVLVGADNVTIQNLTVNGDNPSLTSGVIAAGADLDARNGIVTNHLAGVFNNLLVQNVTVQNMYLRGLYASSGGTFTFSHDTVANVQADPSSVAVFNFGGSGTIDHTAVSFASDAIAANWSTGTQFLSNTITNSASGIHTDNNGGGGGTGDTISGNSVSSCTPGGYGIFAFVPYVNVAISNNTVTGCAFPLAAYGGQGGNVSFTGNTGNAAHEAGSIGLQVTTDQLGFGNGSVVATATLNTFSNAATAVKVDEAGGQTAALTANRNAITGDTIGVVNNAAATVDATCNWWGSASGPITSSGPLSLAPWLVAASPLATVSCSSSIIYVDATLGNDTNPGSQALPKKTIQGGIDAVDPNGAVLVRPGNYSETASNRSPVSIPGTYTFGLYLGKNGITVEGVHADDTPITSRTDAAMPVVTTNSTADFGPDGVFVEGDHDTMTGLHIGENLPSGSCNKTIEVVGDAFTFSNGIVNDPCGGDIYIDDFRYNTGTNTPHVNSYTITGNEIGDGNTIDIGSGPGHGTAASTRLITNNKFDGGGYWPAISFNGADSGIPWFLYPVGGATITGNSFDARDQYIRARGTYDSATFAWDSYFANNTFPGAAMTKTSTNDVRPYSYSTSFPATWNNVRRINGTLQTSHGAGCDGADCNGDVDNAQPTDTVQIRGTINENVSLNKAVSLLGVGVNGATLNGTTTGVAVNSPGALSIQKINFTGSEPSISVASGSVAPLVLRNSVQSLINSSASNVDARCNWWGSASGAATGQTFGSVKTAPFLSTSNLNGSCLPVASLAATSVSTVEGNAGTHPVTVNVTLNGPSTGTAKVLWHTANGTAGSGDLMGASGVLTFAPGQTSKPVTVNVIGDTTLETNEYFFIAIHAVSGVSIGVSQQRVVILNDEKPTLTLAGPLTLTEGASGRYIVSLAQAYYLPVTVTMTTLNGTAHAGSDFGAVTATATFPAGVTQQPLPLFPFVHANVDHVIEGAETFTVRVTSPQANNSPKLMTVTIKANNT